MRIFKRSVGEAAIIAHNVSVKILKIRGDMVRVAVETPKDVPVYRKEVLDELSAAAREALEGQRDSSIESGRERCSG